MLLTVELPDDLSESMTIEARRQGLEMNAYALKLLQSAVPQSQKRERAIQFLADRIALAQSDFETEGDSDSFLRALDEDRLSDRSLFPPELKGITW